MKAGNFARCGILVKNAILDDAHDFWLGFTKSIAGFAGIALGKCFFNFADLCPHARAPGFIDCSASRDDADGFFCGFGIRHI